jgi:hypothetical protein
MIDTDLGECGERRFAKSFGMMQVFVEDGSMKIDVEH